MKYLYGLNYNPETTSNFSAYKWLMVFWMQFTINDYAQNVHEGTSTITWPPIFNDLSGFILFLV